MSLPNLQQERTKINSHCLYQFFFAGIIKILPKLLYLARVVFTLYNRYVNGIIREHRQYT